MNNELEWKAHKLNPEHEKIEYSASFNDNTNKAIETALQVTIEKAVSCLSENVKDESRYFLFEWNIESSTLSIVVTDDTKIKDSKYSVSCHMSALNNDISEIESLSVKKDKTEEYSDFIKYFVKDYLTTCSAFMKFSLVAVFHSSSRDSTELL